MNGVVADQVRIETRGAVREADVVRVRAKVSEMSGVAGAPVRFVRVRLSALRTRGGAIAQANADVDGRPVRVQETAPAMDQAISALGERLRRRLERLSRSPGRRPGPRPNGNGAAPVERRAPAYTFRAVGDGRLTRRKTFALWRETVAEAAEDLELLDYGFHLFTETGSGQDSALYRDDGAYRLVQLVPDPGAVAPAGLRFAVSPVPAAYLDVAGALHRLDRAGLPFVFFADSGTGRGSVVYRRIDGNYGLIEAA